MPTAMIAQWAEDETTDYYGKNILFPKSRVAGTVRPRLAPRSTSALEAYALRTMSEGDPEFSRYLLRFLRDFAATGNRSTVRPMTVLALAGASGSPIAASPGPGSSVDRAKIIALKAEPDPEPLFRVPPFAQSPAEAAVTNSPEREADIAGRRVA